MAVWIGSGLLEHVILNNLKVLELNEAALMEGHRLSLTGANASHAQTAPRTAR